MKFTVCSRPSYCFMYEEVDGLTFVHADVHSWNKHIKQEFMLDLNDLIFLRGAPLYAANFPEGKAKREKFIKLCGFKLLNHVETAQGELDIYAKGYNHG